MLYANAELDTLAGRLVIDESFRERVVGWHLINRSLGQVDHLLTGYRSMVERSDIGSEVVEAALELIFEHHG